MSFTESMCFAIINVISAFVAGVMIAVLRGAPLENGMAIFILIAMGVVLIFNYLGRFHR